jgi:hypothetical protein
MFDDPHDGRRLAWLTFAGLAAWTLAGSRALGGEKLPEAAELTRRMVERAEAVAHGDQGLRFTYDKRSVQQELDGHGQTNKSTEKFYQVTLVGGFPFNRLVKIQGRDLTSAELKKEQQREDRFREKLDSGQVKRKALDKEAWVTPELMDRFEFTVKERVLLNNRPTLVVAFRPKTGQASAKTLQDKVINRLAGTLWVDEADADAAKLSVSLGESVSLGVLGILGSLDRLELSLERQRLPEGVWVNLRQTMLIHARKLVSTSRYRILEESSGFKKAG